MSSVDFGSTTEGAPISRTFTIYNYGYGVLTLDAASLSMPVGFDLVGSFPTEIAASSSASFTLQLDAAALGIFGGNVSFGTNDTDENPFDFMVSGQVNAPEPEIEVQDDYGYTILYDGMSTVDFGSTSQGSPLTRSFTIYNYGDGTLTLDPASLPAGFSLVGTFPGSVMPYSSASFTLQLTATAAGSVGGNVSFGTNDSDEDPFDFMVMAQVVRDPSANLAPTLDPIPNLSAIDEDAGQQVVLLTGITAGAGESQNLTVTAASSNSPLLASLSVAYTSPNTSGTLTFTPAANQSGTALVTVTVRDDGGTANGGVDAFEQTFLVTVNPVNDAPFLVDPIAAIEVAENSIMTVVGLDWYFGDVDIATNGDALDYSVAVNPGDPNDPEYDSDLLVASIVDRGLRLEYAPGRTGHVDVTVRASDLAGLWAETTVRVTVTPVGNSAPVVVDAIEDLSVEVGQPDIVIELAGVFADPDVLAGTDSLAYAVTNSAQGVLSETLSGSVLTLSLLPGGLGTAQFTVRATDTEGAYAETSFSATVLPFNNPPLASVIPPVVVDEDAADLVLGLRDFFSDAEDPDQAIVLDVALNSISSPDLLVPTLNELTGELTLAFLQDGSGTAEYAIMARDSGGKTATATLAVTVNPVNDAPTGPVGLIELPLEVSPSETIVDLWEYFYDVEDGWDLTYEIVADSITNPALFEGTPSVDADDYLRLYAAAGASGASDLSIRATDGDGAATLSTLRVTTSAGTGGDPAPLPIVSIVDLKHTGENAPAPGFFVVQAVGEFTDPLQIFFSLGGTADPDTDYDTDAPALGVIELTAPGDSVTISITALDDADIDGAKSVTLVLQGGSTYQVGEGVGNTVWVNDDDNGAVVYVARAKSTWEGATGDDEGAFVIEAIGSLSFVLDPMYSDYTGPVPPPGGFTWGLYGPAVDLTTLQVPYQFSGSATWGDYASPDGTGSVTITSPGSATVRIVAAPDESPEGNEDVTLELLLDPDPEPGPGEPASKYTYFNPVYAGDQWAGCLQVGTYGLAVPGHGTLTIAELCGCDLPNGSGGSEGTVARAPQASSNPTTSTGYYGVGVKFPSGAIKFGAGNGRSATFIWNWGLLDVFANVNNAWQVPAIPLSEVSVVQKVKLTVKVTDAGGLGKNKIEGTYTEINDATVPDSQGLHWDNLKPCDNGTMVQETEVYVARQADTSNPVPPTGEVTTRFDNTGTQVSDSWSWAGYGAFGWVRRSGYPQTTTNYVPSEAGSTPTIDTVPYSLANYALVAKMRTEMTYKIDKNGNSSAQINWKFQLVIDGKVVKTWQKSHTASPSDSDTLVQIP